MHIRSRQSKSGSRRIPRYCHVRVLRDSIANLSIAYLICNSNCSVVLQTLNLDGTKTEASCSFEPTSIEQFYFDIELQIIPANKDRVIIGYIGRFGSLSDYDYVFANIRLSDCKVTETTLSQHSSMARSSGTKEFVLTKNNDDTYTILFLDEKMCGSNYCRMNLNSEGEVVSGPTSWFKVHPNFYMPDKLFSIPTNLSSEKYVLVYLVEDDLYHVDFSSIESNEYKEFISFTSNKSFTLDGGYTLDHGLFTVCFGMRRANPQCTQFDLVGNVELTGDNKTSKESPILVQPFGLPNGGFLLFKIDCLKFGRDINFCRNLESQNYRVSRYDAQGKLVGSLEIEGFTCNTYTEQVLKPNYYVNEAGEHCLFLVCTNIGVRKYLKSAINCFSDEDFKMSIQ